MKLNIPLFIIALLLNVGPVAARTITCVIPKNIQAISNDYNYIKLFEPKTIINLDARQDVTKFYSPGCNTFSSLSKWTKTLVINCNSNNAGKVEIKINTSDFDFKKTYYKNGKKNLSIQGFCTELGN